MLRCLAAILMSIALGAGSAQAQTFRPTGSSAIPATLEDGVYTVRVEPDACDPTPYPGMTESDCEGGNRRSQLLGAGSSAAQGESWAYEFDFRVPEGFSYVPDRLVWRMAPLSKDERFLLFSRLNMAEWKKDRPKNHIYHLKLDSILGATFLDRVCAGPEKFGEWVSFRMEVKWGERGFMRVTCDDEVIYEALTDTSTNPFCIPEQHCEGTQHESGLVNQPLGMFVGLTSEAATYGMPSTVPPEGYSLEYRNLSAKRTDDVTRPSVLEAQQALLDRGFDPNGVDGLFGRGTAAALRAFQESEGLEPTGAFDVPTYAALRIGAALPVPESVGIASPDDLPAMRAYQEELLDLDVANLGADSEIATRLIAGDVFSGGSSFAFYFDSRIMEVPYSHGHFLFTLNGTKSGDGLTNIRIRPERFMGASYPDWGRDCRLNIQYSDFHKQIVMVYPLQGSGDSLTLNRPACLDRADVPPIVVHQYRLMAENFPRIAAAIAASPQFDDIEIPQLANWLKAVGDGTITIAVR